MAPMESYRAECFSVVRSLGEKVGPSCSCHACILTRLFAGSGYNLGGIGNNLELLKGGSGWLIVVPTTDTVMLHKMNSNSLLLSSITCTRSIKGRIMLNYIKSLLLEQVYYEF